MIKKVKKYLIIGTVMYGMTLQLCQGGNNEGKIEKMSFKEYMKGMMKTFEIICQEQNRCGEGIISRAEFNKRADTILKNIEKIDVEKVILKKKDNTVNRKDLKFIKNSTIETLNSTVVFNVKNCMLIGGEEACRKRAKNPNCNLNENKKEIENMIDAYEGKKKEKRKI